MDKTEKPFPVALFRKACELLWGSSWVGPAARFFGVAERTVGRWKNEEYESVPPGLRAEAAKECREHAARLVKMAERLEG